MTTPSLGSPQRSCLDPVGAASTPRFKPKTGLTASGECQRSETLNLHVLMRKVRSGLIRARRLVVSQRFGFSPTTIYDEKFYRDCVDANALPSAGDVMQVVLECFAPKSVFDVGCGNGIYLAEAASMGLLAAGCDGSEVAVKLAPRGALVFQHDLKRRLRLNRRFDVCLCFEVAEHIPRWRCRNLIESCSDVSDTIVFSTPTKGEGGIDHINEQPQEFWDRLFSDRNFHCDELMTVRVRSEFRSRHVVKWLADHTRIYRAVSPKSNSSALERSSAEWVASL